MHLTKLFNFKYLIQNLKKSKGVLAVFLGLIPLLNFLIFLVRTLNADGTQLFSLSEISGVNMVGAFLIPVILSYSLFGYLFKKKSVDFIGAMPIDRKTIFISNTIGGIFLILIMNILNIVLLSTVANLFNGFLLPFEMALDYFILWTITYIFIFVVTNLAIVLSGNMISGVVVTCLVLFLFPFLNDYMVIKNDQNNSNMYLVRCTDSACEPISYYCSDKECTENLKNNIYQTHMDKILKAPSHPAPYSYISNYIIYNYSGYETNFFDIVAIIKMVIGSIICFVLGLYAFIKRKMEHCETSFSSMIIHNIVKSLVLVPVLCVMLEIMAYETIALIIFVALIIIYYLVYDLITMRKICLKRNAIITFLLMAVLIISSLTTINYFANNKENDIINVSDIKSVAITFDNDYLNKEIYIEDKELINYIMSIELANYDYKTEIEEDANDIIYYTFKTDNEKYHSNSWISKKTYAYLMDYLSKSEVYTNSIRNVSENIDAIAFDKLVCENKEEVLELINSKLQNINLKDYINTFNKTSIPVEVKLVSYKNHDLTYKTIPAGLSNELQNKIVEVKNNALYKALDKQMHVDNEVYMFIYNTLQLPELGSLNHDIIIEYLIDYSHNEIINFIIAHKDAKIDLSKEYIYLDIFINGTDYNFATNDIKGFKEVLLKKHKQLLKTNEYNNFLNNIEKEIEYYD